MRRLVLTATIALLLARVAMAQSTPSASNDEEAAIKARLRSDLRNLVVAQESYFASHSAYADVIDNLQYRPSSGSLISLTATQNRAWAAVASDPTWPGKSCVIYVNLAEKYRPKTNGDKRAPTDDDEGRPICDGDPTPQQK